jgi:hypothetical protein
MKSHAAEDAETMRPLKISGTLLALGAAAIATAASALSAQLGDWVRLDTPNLAFALSYPGSVFVPEAARQQQSGHVLASRDGRARLLVATFPNEEGASLAEYRQQLIADNYASADLDFAPVKKRWFVLSGTQGDTHFYYRVSFACGNSLINSWALIYPNAERAFYDRVVEAVARTYEPASEACR